jgi:hypothetical protein
MGLFFIEAESGDRRLGSTTGSTACWSGAILRHRGYRRGRNCCLLRPFALLSLEHGERRPCWESIMKRGPIDHRVTHWVRYAVVIFLLLNQIALPPDKAVAEQQSAKVTASRPACPSKDFTKFFDAFAESAEIQKTFTQLPLTYGLLHLSEFKFSRRRIASFEMIPSYNTEDSGAIFPTLGVRTKFGNLIYMGNGAGNRTAIWRRHTAGANADEGSNNCWKLYAIDDRST